jgi:MFS family permease
VALQPVLDSAPAWVVIRLVTGFGCAGLFITVESWLNSTSQPQNRGTIFAIYMVATNAAFGLGQFLNNLPAPQGFELFSLAAALFCVALVPVALTRSAAPTLLPSPRLRLRELRRLAPVAFAGCATTGLVSSAFYSLVPAFAQTQGVPQSAISAWNPPLSVKPILSHWC